MMKYPYVPPDCGINSPSGKNKLDILDWEALDAFPGPYDLNYRMSCDSKEETRRL